MLVTSQPFFKIKVDYFDWQFYALVSSQQSAVSSQQSAVSSQQSAVSTSFSFSSSYLNFLFIFPGLFQPGFYLLSLFFLFEKS